MDEDRPEDTSPPPDSGRAKRAPPTIDLEASEVSGETQGAGAETNADAQPEQSSERSSARSFPWPSAISAMLTAAVTSAVTALLVVAVAWVVGWPGETAPPPTSPQTNASAIDTLTSRVDDIEARSARSPAEAPDPAARRDSKRWKNPLRRCAPRSPAPARSRKSWRPNSMR